MVTLSEPDFKDLGHQMGLLRQSTEIQWYGLAEIAGCHQVANFSFILSNDKVILWKGITYPA